MFSTPQHQIDEALSKFTLIDGEGDGRTTACAMTMLGWLAGHKKWTDKPICAHPELADIVIEANDSEYGQFVKTGKTDSLGYAEHAHNPKGEGRAERARAHLVELGYEGVLDTWWIPDEIIKWATKRRKSETTPYKRAVGVLKRIAKWKQTRHKMEKIDGKWRRIS